MAKEEGIKFAYFTCRRCGSRKPRLGSRMAKCMGCMKRRAVCKVCHPLFNGCDDECRLKHRAWMRKCWKKPALMKEKPKKKPVAAVTPANA